MSAPLPAKQVSRPHRRKQAPAEAVEFHETYPLVFWVPKYRLNFDYSDLLPAFGGGKGQSHQP